MSENLLEVKSQSNKNVTAEDVTHFFSELIRKTTEETVKALRSKDIINNVAIFVDYDNVYWTLTKNFSHDPNHKDPSKNLIVKLWDKYKKDNVRSFRVYGDFEKIKPDLTSLQKQRVQLRHVYSNGKDGDRRKNSSDIELCIDAIELSYRDPSITCFVFVTADSDMIPIMSRMMYKGKRVDLYYLSKAAPQHVDITNYAHYSQDLIEFLNIEVKDYNIDDFIDNALLFIRDWHHRYRNNNELFLGKSWLRKQLTQKLPLSENDVSLLIERLTVKKYIIEENKEVILKNGNKDTKASVRLTEEGFKKIKKITDLVASTDETNFMR